VSETGVEVGAAVAGGSPARVCEEISCEQRPEDERASPCERKTGKPPLRERSPVTLPVPANSPEAQDVNVSSIKARVAEIEASGTADADAISAGSRCRRLSSLQTRYDRVSSLPATSPQAVVA
jgi:hypothetical protein